MNAKPPDLNQIRKQVAEITSADSAANHARIIDMRSGEQSPRIR